ncbi:MAG: class I SAM-dependent methyltransferase [Kofleriaceae bacterium]|nr:class I SAM-dependent methyltransferase [Kofleriaceae bacterium]
MLRKIVTELTARTAKFVVRQSGNRHDVDYFVQQAAVKDSAEYAVQHMSKGMRFPDRYGLFKRSFQLAPANGIALEFGVYTGRSMRFLGALFPQRKFFGFDSFVGLKEAWIGTSALAGRFNVGGKLPKVPPNVTLLKGWFDESLPPFLAEHDEPLAFVHIDSDTYESTKTVLDLLESRLVPGVVIQFDEYFGYPGWRENEFRAFQEFIKRTGLRYEYIGYGYVSVAVILRS